MKQQRLDGLADGIFAITMTLLVFELRPVLNGAITDDSVLNALWNMRTTFAGLLLSFALLFTYWRAHHFIVSVYAKTLTVSLANYNAAFLFLISLVPFSSYILGQYSHTHVAIIIYSVHVILIGITLFFMRRYIERNPLIEKIDLHRDERVSGYVRILFPVIATAIAIVVCFYSRTGALTIITLSIIFNLLPASTNLIHNWLVETVKGEEKIIPFD